MGRPFASVSNADTVPAPPPLGVSAASVDAWGVEEVLDWLDEAGLGEYRDIFRENRIDGGVLRTLCEADLKWVFFVMFYAAAIPVVCALLLRVLPRALICTGSCVAPADIAADPGPSWVSHRWAIGAR